MADESTVKAFAEKPKEQKKSKRGRKSKKDKERERQAEIEEFARDIKPFLTIPFDFWASLSGVPGLSLPEVDALSIATARVAVKWLPEFGYYEEAMLGMTLIGIIGPRIALSRASDTAEDEVIDVENITDENNAELY